MTQVTVRLFASARELTGRDTIQLPATAGLTVALLRVELGRMWPSLEPLLGRSAIAVNRRYADDLTVVSAADEVALIPPVAGG